ncbi:hypothetical protein DN069_13790 [Streptacidiphilus pinicola]|uniref:Uncharacterized protein n=1 Tax=Streptacidiphilus pinicola TaxID=2219663 RepID=A0A2X0IK50_9ACTN|nr:hypothetical protein [Streptacidiphilus pinicola]RAG85027.1 hypothetical protein DN069_13790 [Streptacidiphilus pinicola]
MTDHADVEQAVAELQRRTAGWDFAYLADIGAFMADLPRANGAQPVRCLDGEDIIRQRWRHLVLARRAYLQGR